jgi:hypothetical protein
MPSTKCPKRQEIGACLKISRLGIVPDFETDSVAKIEQNRSHSWITPAILRLASGQSRLSGEESVNRHNGVSQGDFALSAFQN